jgi:hypothetical protein
LATRKLRLATARVRGPVIAKRRLGPGLGNNEWRVVRSRGWHRRHHLVRGRPDPLPAAGGRRGGRGRPAQPPVAPGDATLAPCVASVPPTAA